MPKHKYEDDGDRCGTCAKHKANDVNTKMCNNPDSPYHGQIIDSAVLGRMDALKPDVHCGVWIGGSRFTKEVKDTNPFRPM